MHAKYVTGRPEGPQEYVALRAGEGRDANGAVCAWGGPAMLRTWIANSVRYRDDEKVHVEKAVAETPTVIDLEMGHPAGEGQKTSLRMGIVALERHDGTIRIAFWEAKMIGDPRLRSKIFEPEVLKTQVAAYERFLEPETNRRRVADAYRRACGLLGSIHGMARRVAPSLPDLDPLILAAAEADSPLGIEPRPRLVVFDDGGRRSEDHWQKHLAVLRKHVHVAVLIARPYGLPVPGSAA